MNDTKTSKDSKICIEENKGQNFLLEKQNRAQELAWNILNKVQQKIQQGMSEADIASIVNSEYKSNSIQKKWHETKVRVGENTLCSFNEKSDPNVVLKENDIYFLDLGPVIDDHEADVGNTFCIGSEVIYKNACSDVKEIFDMTSEYWKNSKVTGEQLYRYAKTISEEKGWQLQARTQGHRICDFPHALYHKGKLLNFTGTPSADAWVLEIQIRHPIKPFGAFYEDILK